MTEKTVAESLGRAVQVRRAELGLKRPELAKRSGLSYPYLSEIENGMKSPSTAALEKLAEALDLSMAELVGRAEVARPAPTETGLHSEVGDPTRRARVATGAPEGRREVAPEFRTDYERRLADLIASTMRAELAAWARTELPLLVREELERALAGRGERL